MFKFVVKKDQFPKFSFAFVTFVQVFLYSNGIESCIQGYNANLRPPLSKTFVTLISFYCLLFHSRGNRKRIEFL